jgi:hypothetical protein
MAAPVRCVSGAGIERGMRAHMRARARASYLLGGPIAVAEKAADTDTLPDCFTMTF